MNDSKNSRNGLLVLRYPMALPIETIDRLIVQITPIADELGVQPLVLGDGADAAVSIDYSSLLTRLCVAVEALVAQGAEPDLGSANVAENAPQALNARRTETGLNSRPAYTSEEYNRRGDFYPGDNSRG